MRPRMACPWCCGDLYPVTIFGSRRMVCLHCRHTAPAQPRPGTDISGYEEEHFRRLLRSGSLDQRLVDEVRRRRARPGSGSSDQVA